LGEPQGLFERSGEEKNMSLPRIEPSRLVRRPTSPTDGELKNGVTYLMSHVFGILTPIWKFTYFQIELMLDLQDI
jgi:hypothetical protein